MRVHRLVGQSMLGLIGVVALTAACSGMGDGRSGRSSSRAAGDDADEGSTTETKPGGTQSSCVSTVAIKNSFGGRFVIPRDLNDRGQVVGSAAMDDAADASIHGFVWNGGTLVDLGALEGGESDAMDINENGDIVGSSEDATGKHAVLWRDGQIIDLGTLGGENSIGGAINNTGQVVGNAQTAEGQTHAFLYENGAMRDLGTLGGDFSSALGINDAGQIYGHSSVSNDTKRHIFLWENGTMTDLGPERPEDLNARGDVLIGLAPDLYLWRNGTRMEVNPFGDSTLTGARDLNDNGAVIGAATRASGRVVSFLWQDGNSTWIGSEAVPDATALSINNATQVVGYVGEGANPRAMSWKNGVFTYLDEEGEMTIALKVNNRGQIMGHWHDGSEGRLWEVKSCANEDAGADHGDSGSGKTW